jgi:homoserine/homoserine lactone efflux protein
MEVHLWLAYVSVVGILIFIPGPSAFLCLSHGLTHGKLRTIFTVLGGAVASLLLMSISISGLGAILAASEQAFFIIRITGAVYLIYLGVSYWNQGSFRANHKIHIENDKTGSSFSLFKKGFLVGVSNPKDLLFFAALFPGFINTQSSQVEQYLILALTWFTIDFCAMFMYANLGNKASSLFSKPTTIQIFNRASGGFYFTTGSTLALSSVFDESLS